MISHYALYETADLSNYFHIAEGLPKGIKPNYNISPTVDAPVIVNEAGAHTIKLMKFGLVAKDAKDTNSVFRYKTFNIPSEKIFSRHSWEQAVRERRCLVPVNGFYELNDTGTKRAFYAHSNSAPLFTLAGVYSSWQDPKGTVHGTFSIVTVEANEDMPSFNTRMPVIIKPEDETRWLDPTINDMGSLYDMLRMPAEGGLNVYEVSSAIHSPKPNQASLIERI